MLMNRMLESPFGLQRQILPRILIEQGKRISFIAVYLQYYLMVTNVIERFRGPLQLVEGRGDQ